MDSENAEDALNISKRKLEEDVYINDVASIVKRSRGGEEYLAPNLLHLSDDVLLFILRNCPPRDLKALSFSCQRLKRLCGDRSLWVKADLRRRPIGEKALAGYVRKLRPITQALCVRGLVGRQIPNKEEIKESKPEPPAESSGAPWVGRSNVKVTMRNVAGECDVFMTVKPGNYQQQSVPSTSACETPPAKENGNSSPKPYNSPKSTDTDVNNLDGSATKEAVSGSEEESADSGIYTMTKKIMDDVVRRCPNMKELRLEYCNIDCLTLVPLDCPSTLEILSLKGCVCHNIPINRTYLFNLHRYMKDLVELDLSGCDWLSAHSLLQLSKMEHLKKLSLRNCHGIGECVAYASLSARYGFKSLEILDIRGTLISDSEVSSLTWIETLQELYLEPPSAEKVSTGSHSRPTTAWAISGGNWTITGGNYADNCMRHGSNSAGCTPNGENVGPVPIPAWKKSPRRYLEDDLVALDHPDDCGTMEDWELEAPFDDADDDEFLPCPQKEEEGDKAEQQDGAKEGCSLSTCRSSQTDFPRSGGSGSGANEGGEPPVGDAAVGDDQRPGDHGDNYSMRINGERFENGLVQVIYVNVRRPRADVNAVIVAPELPMNHNIRVEVDVEQIEYNRQNAANRQGNEDNAHLNVRVEEDVAPDDRNNLHEQGVMHHIFINRQRHARQDAGLAPEPRNADVEVIRHPPVRGQIRRIFMNNAAELDRNLAEIQNRPVIVGIRPEVAPQNRFVVNAEAMRLERPEVAPNPNEAVLRMERVFGRNFVPDIQGWAPFPMNRRANVEGGENLPSFRNLRHLSNSELVTDDTLRRFAAIDLPCLNRATRLRVLVCRGYSGITDRGLQIMANSRTALRLLDVSGTRVSAEARAAFRRLRPECKLIHEDDSDSDD